MDQPTIETPVVEDAHFVENVPRRGGALIDAGPPRFGNPFVYAVERAFAAVLDLAVPAFAVTGTVYGLFAINPLTGLPTRSALGYTITFVAGLLAALALIVVSQAAFGNTLGKLAVGLRLQRASGGRPSTGRVIARTALLAIDALGIGFLLALLPGHRRLGDLAAGTVVARLRHQRIAPLGWAGLAILAAVPFVLVGPWHALAAIVAFFEFVPAGVSAIAHAALGAAGVR